MSRSFPLVSIGLPVYNGAKHLADALEGLIAQDYSNLEIVVCDNASTDETPAILERFAKRCPFLRIERRERNYGAVDNFKRVLELARGEFFVWAAHDDRRTPSFIRRCAEQLLLNPEAVACTTRVHFLKPDGTLDWESLGNQSRLRHLAPPEEQLRHWLLTPYPYDLYGMFRREAIAELSFPECFGPDVAYMVQVIARGLVAVIEEPLFEYRFTGKTVNDYAEMLPGFDLDRPRSQLAAACYRALRESPLPPERQEALIEAMIRTMAFDSAGWRYSLLQENASHLLFPLEGTPEALRRFLAALLDPALLDRFAPLVSFVVLCRNEALPLLRTLEAIATHAPAGLYEVVIADRGSTDETGALLEGLEGRVRVLRLEATATGEALEAALTAASGDFVAWMEPGAELTPGAVQRLAARLAADAALGVVGPRVGGGPDAAGERLTIWHEGRTDGRPGPGVALFRRRLATAAGDRRGWKDLADLGALVDWLVQQGAGSAVVPDALVVFLEARPAWAASAAP